MHNAFKLVGNDFGDDLVRDIKETNWPKLLDARGSGHFGDQCD